MTQPWRQALAAITLRDFCQDPETGLLCGSEPSGGSDSSSGGKGGGKAPPVSQGSGTEPDHFAKIKAAMAAIPKGHAEQIAKANVTVAFVKTPDEFPSHGAASVGKATAGLFSFTDPKHPTIHVAENVIVQAKITEGTQTRIVEDQFPVRQKEQVTVHELGHALDFANEWKHSSSTKFVNNFMAGERGMTADEKSNASYWLANRREEFAELYSAVHNPNQASNQRYFGGLTKARTEELFADAIGVIREIKRLKFIRRQDEPPPPQQTSGWFVNSHGALYAILNGMPYEVDVAGTPFAKAKLKPGTYPDDAALFTANDIQTKDFCQDPETGLLCGSEPGAGSSSEGGGKGGKGKAKVESLGKFRKDGVQVHTPNEEKFLEIWNDKVGMEPADFKKSFMGGTEGKMTVELRTFNLLQGPKGKPAKLVQEHYLKVDGKIMHQGKELASFHRTIDPKKNTASSDEFEVAKDAQAKGIGKTLLAGNVATYREMGLKKVETHANLDVGGYAWAKYGYVPQKSAWSGAKSQLRAQLKERFDKIPPHLASDKPWLAKIINSKDPKAIWALADSAYGKYFLLGSSWHGDLVLTDKDSMARFDAYVGKKSAKKMFTVVRADPKRSKKSPPPESKELYYIDDDGVAQDAELHNEILDQGDDAAAKKISDRIKAEILGEKAMPMNPHKDESKTDFMARCVPDMIGSGPDKRPNDQAVGICIDIWDRNKGKTAKPDVTKQPEPEPDEDYQDFMDRCMEEADESECQLAWENRGLASRTTKIDRDGMTIQKTHAGHIDGAEYVLSDETIDRMGDTIQSDGWRLDNFKKNPIALFNHRADFIVGKWRNLRVEDGVLRGHLQLAPEGTSPRIDEIRKLVEAGILKATSVGFRPLRHEPLDKSSTPNPFGGIRFLEQELVETSLVSVPANPNALAIAKSLDISDTTLRLVFAGQGKGKPADIVRRSHGGQADTSRIRTKDKAMSLAQNIVDTQNQLGMLRDGLQEHLDNLDNENVTDDQMKKTDDFHQKIARKRKLLDQMVESEKALGLTLPEPEAHEIRMPVRKIDPPSSSTKIPATVGTSYKPGDYTWKSLVTLVKLQGDKYRKSTALEVLRDTVGENDKVRAVFDTIIGKAATVPALTTATGWAAELVRQDIQGFMDTLQPAAVATRLLNKGTAFTFGTNGIISIPGRSPTPTIAGSFVGEGAPIPVRQGAFTAIQLVPKKMAVITVFSREISEHSDPAIEGILRQAIVDDTAVALDSVLLDANAATAVRPAGLRSGVSTLTPTAGGGFAAVIGDIKLLVGALTTSTLGNLRSPVWLMSPLLELGLRLTVLPNGTWAFKDEIERGTLGGIPVIVSPNVTVDTLFLIDAADLVSASGEPRFDVSDSATVHMEDTTPLAISSSGTPNTVAAPVRSFWQTDTLGIRMIMPMNWAMRRTGMVAYITGTTWD